MPSQTSLAQPEQEIAAVRAFNRFYTRKLEVLDQHLHKTPFSLSEARVMFELAHRGDLSAKEIGWSSGSTPAISAASSRNSTRTASSAASRSLRTGGNINSA